jgi:hypothetical protein
MASLTNGLAQRSGAGTVMGTASGTGGNRRPVGHHLGELLGHAGGAEPRRDDRVCAKQPRVLDHPVDRVLLAVLEQLSVLSHLALAHRLESNAHRLNGTRAAHDQAEGDVKVPLDCDAWRPVPRQLAGPAAGADCVMPVKVGTPAAAPPYPGARRSMTSRRSSVRRMRGRTATSRQNVMGDRWCWRS